MAALVAGLLGRLHSRRPVRNVRVALTPMARVTMPTVMRSNVGISAARAARVDGLAAMSGPGCMGDGHALDLRARKDPTWEAGAPVRPGLTLPLAALFALG